MPRYFFNTQHGETMLDDEGVELADMRAVRIEAIQSSGEMLKEMDGNRFWSGESWKLWVTDRPDGGGNTVLRLEFSSRTTS
jgi:hypothetical protein